MLKTDFRHIFPSWRYCIMKLEFVCSPIVILSLKSMEPRHSEATRLIKVLIEGPRVCCGGGQVAVNCRACVIPVSCTLTSSLSLCVCCLDSSQSKYYQWSTHSYAFCMSAKSLKTTLLYLQNQTSYPGHWRRSV